MIFRKSYDRSSNAHDLVSLPHTKAHAESQLNSLDQFVINSGLCVNTKKKN